MNKDNLIPGAHKLTREENSLGGINSAISRRAKKRALEIARDILSMPVDEGSPTDVSEMSSLKDASEITLDVLSLILVNMSKKAINGDLRACRDLLTISGDYTIKQETTIELNDTMYDPDNVHYIHRIGFEEGIDPYEVRYYDNDGNLGKVVYGEEAKRLIDQKSEEDKKAGIPVQFEISFDCDDESVDLGNSEATDEIKSGLQEVQKVHIHSV